MIDEKKIEETKEEIYDDRFLLNGEEIVFNNDEKEEMFFDRDIKEAIGLGAKWAINEFLKDLWHDAKEIPNPFVYVLAETYEFHTEYKVLMFHGGDPWEKTVKFNNITRWLYIDDLLKGGKEAASGCIERGQ